MAIVAIHYKKAICSFRSIFCPFVEMLNIINRNIVITVTCFGNSDRSIFAKTSFIKPTFLKFHSLKDHHRWDNVAVRATYLDASSQFAIIRVCDVDTFRRLESKHSFVTRDPYAVTCFVEIIPIACWDTVFPEDALQSFVMVFQSS